MNGIFKSLPFRLLIGVAAGIVLGLWASGFAYGGQVMQVVLTLKELLGSLINFCVPLIIIGFIAPSITRLKQNASRMLALALVLGLCLKGGSTDMMTLIWIAAMVIFGVVEAITVGLTSIWFVVGSVAGLIAAICGGPIWLQLALFFVVSIVCLAATRPLVKKLLHKDVTATNADRVLGQTARVTESIDNAVPTGAVYVGGMTWIARSESGQPIPRNAQVKIVRMEGVRLFVEPV
mgnify:CR=1 FL=1